MRLKPIDEQVVVVFGASSGIGRETALRFARQGARVVVAARNEQGLQSLVDEIRQQGGEAIPVTADTAEFDQVRAVAERAVAEYGRIDTWAHIAGVGLYSTFEETLPEEFKRTVEVNLLGPAYGAMAALPYLKQEGRGALIVVTSIDARRPAPLSTAYAAGKSGTSTFLSSLRMELAHEGVPVSVTEILPGSINTPFFNKARSKMGVKPRGIPPIYGPSLVTDAILYAAVHPTREIVVGGIPRMTAINQRLMPRLMDGLFSMIGFQSQRTNEPKPAGAPDALFGPVEGYNHVEGDFTDQAVKWAPSSVLVRPVVRYALAGAALGLVTLLLLRQRMGGEVRRIAVAENEANKTLRAVHRARKQVEHHMATAHHRGILGAVGQVAEQVGKTVPAAVVGAGAAAQGVGKRAMEAMPHVSRRDIERVARQTRREIQRAMPNLSKKQVGRTIAEARERVAAVMPKRPRRSMMEQVSRSAAVVTALAALSQIPMGARRLWDVVADEAFYRWCRVKNQALDIWETRLLPFFQEQ